MVRLDELAHGVPVCFHDHWLDFYPSQRDQPIPKHHLLYVH